MISYPAKNLFECRLPELEEGEEEIFFKHPLYPFECNQLGIIYPIEGEERELGESEQGYLYLTGNGFIGTKLKFVMSCYLGQNVSGKIIRKNINPLDFSIDNLALIADYKPYQRIKRRKEIDAFCESTKQELIERWERGAKRFGISLLDFKLALQIPPEVVTVEGEDVHAWKKRDIF